MGKRGPQCSICKKSELCKSVNELLDRKLTYQQIAAKTDLHHKTIGRHARECRNEETPITVGKPKRKPPRMPAIEGLDDKAKAEVLVTYLHAQLRWMGRNAGGDTKSIALLTGQLLNAQKTLAKLNGAFDLTETQIVRSTPWKAIMAKVIAVLEKHPAAALDLQRVLGELEAQGKL